MRWLLATSANAVSVISSIDATDEPSR